jgi:hypothetical protein
VSSARRRGLRRLTPTERRPGAPRSVTSWAQPFPTPPRLPAVCSRPRRKRADADLPRRRALQTVLRGTQPGVVAPHAQHPVVRRHAVRPPHAAPVEVLHDQPVAGLGDTDDADRVGKQLVVVAGALNEEAAALQPLERDAARHDFVDQRMGRLGSPGADQRTGPPKHRSRSSVMFLGPFHPAELAARGAGKTLAEDDSAHSDRIR